MLKSLSLLFERLVYKRINNWFKTTSATNSMFFCIVRSNLTQSHVYCDKLFSEPEAKEKPISVFLDLAKAFDTISFKIIILKLSQFVFDENFLPLFKSYILGRQQQLVISDSASNYVNVTSGAPQGTILQCFCSRFI